MTTTTDQANPADRADLTRRLRAAWELVEQATAAGDTAKARKAEMRAVMRTLQIDHLDALPERYECPQCLWGEANWPYLETRMRDLTNCPAHYTGIAADEAKRLMEMER